MAKIELLENGENAFPIILRDIRKATKSIQMNVFIWRDDIIGNRIGKALLGAANRGVKIYISKDKLGAIHERGEETKQSFLHKDNLPEFRLKIFALKKMYSVKGKNFPDTQRENKLPQLLLKNRKIILKKDEITENHSKYFIIDDKILIIGGINIEDKELFKDIKNRKYLDLMVRIEGNSIVKQFKNKIVNKTKFDFDKEIDFIANIRQKFEVKSVFIKLLENARESILIENSYWKNREILDTLLRMSQKGIEITLLMPNEANLQNDLNLKIAKYLLKKSESKIKIYLTNDMLHTKLLFIDEKIIVIGSSNLNNLSLNKMQETNIFLNGKNSNLTEKLRVILENHKKNSLQISQPEQIRYNFVKAFWETIFT